MIKSNLFPIPLTLLLLTVAFLPVGAQPLPSGRPVSPPSAPQRADETEEREAINYSIRIEWRQSGGVARHLEVLTTEGNVSLDSVLPEKVKIDENEIPVTVRLQAKLRAIDAQKGRLDLFLGRTIPYVTGTHINPAGQRSSSHQQMSVGMSSNLIVAFGKAIVVQSDGNESISVLVKRAEP